MGRVYHFVIPSKQFTRGHIVNIECNLIISLLKLTQKGPVAKENVKKDFRITTSALDKLLQKMQGEGLIYLKNDKLELDTNLRLKLTVRAISMGADIEHISTLLCWQEFEEIAAIGLNNNGYSVAKNVRFKHAGHKWEIDVIGCRRPLVVCIDCKHWQHAIAASALRRIVDSQVERTEALANSLPNLSLKLECTKWGNAKFIPAIMSLMASSFKFYDRVPVVPILQLQDFLNQLPAHIETLKFFPKTFSFLSHNF
jgi:Holliday junction resolvase-like predicted endonuclease